MFINTIAVGPLEPGVTCVGATVALPLRHCELYDEKTDVVGVIKVARFAARDRGAARRAIVKFAMREKASSRSVMLSYLTERPEQPFE
jgi:hypothetical protein